MSAGNRGKYAEGVFRKWAKARSDAVAWFSFMRYPDARAGSPTTVPADFGAMQNGKHYLLEIKEVDHDYRLPHKNFSADKIARMRKWEMAGSEAWVLIYFTPLKQWRIETVGYFLMKDGGSWDMRGFPLLTKEQAFLQIFGD